MADKNITIINQLDQLEYLADTMEMISGEWDIPMNIALNLNLVLEEVVTNIIFYGYDDKDEHEININLSYKDNIIKVRIEDDGREFDPLQAPEPDMEKTIEESKIGGLGIHFVRTIMDDINYLRLDNKNRLTLTKHII
jgi:serine/threonine-protein kinase RsbW